MQQMSNGRAGRTLQFRTLPAQTSAPEAGRPSATNACSPILQRSSVGSRHFPAPNRRIQVRLLPTHLWCLRPFLRSRVIFLRCCCCSPASCSFSMAFCSQVRNGGLRGKCSIMCSHEQATQTQVLPPSPPPKPTQGRARGGVDARKRVEAERHDGVSTPVLSHAV